MIVEISHPGILLRLATTEAILISNALNEVLNGIDVPEFGRG